MPYLSDSELDEISANIKKFKKPPKLNAKEIENLAIELKKLKDEKIAKWKQEGIFDGVNSLVQMDEGVFLSETLEDIGEILKERKQTGTYRNSTSLKLALKFLQKYIAGKFSFANLSKVVANIGDPVFQQALIENSDLCKSVNKNSKIIGPIISDFLIIKDVLEYKDIPEMANLVEFATREENKDIILKTYFQASDSSNISEYNIKDIKKSIVEKNPEFHHKDYYGLISGLLKNIVEDKNQKSYIKDNANIFTNLIKNNLNIQQLLKIYHIDQKALNIVPEILENPEKLDKLIAQINLNVEFDKKMSEAFLENPDKLKSLYSRIKLDEEILKDPEKLKILLSNVDVDKETSDFFYKNSDKLKSLYLGIKLDEEILKDQEKLKNLFSKIQNNKIANEIFQFIKESPKLREIIEKNPEIIRDSAIGIVKNIPEFKDLVNDNGINIKILNLAVPLLRDIDKVQDLYNSFTKSPSIHEIGQIISKNGLHENQEFIESLVKNKGAIIHLCNERKIANKTINQLKEALLNEDYTKRYLSNIADLGSKNISTWLKAGLGIINKGISYVFKSNQLTDEKEITELLSDYIRENKMRSFKDYLSETDRVINFNNLVFENKNANMSAIDFDKMDFQNTTFSNGANFNKATISNSTFQPNITGKLDLSQAMIRNTKFDFSESKGQNFDIDLSGINIDTKSMESLLDSYEKNMNADSILTIDNVHCSSDEKTNEKFLAKLIVLKSKKLALQNELIQSNKPTQSNSGKTTKQSKITSPYNYLI